MEHIESLRDLKKYGIESLTGESCGLGLRLLCDVTEKGRQIVAKAFGLPPDMKLLENWNQGTAADPHVGCVLLTPDMTFLLSVFALLESGCRKVLSFWDKKDHQWVRTIGGGTDDEFRQYQEVYGIRCNSRWFGYTGTAGDRNCHEMSGRVR